MGLFDFYLWGRLEDIDRKSQHARARSLQRTFETRKHVERTAVDVARVALVTRTLGELCLEKGLFTAAEFRAKFEQIDSSDGTSDEALDPGAVRPGAPVRRSAPVPKAAGGSDSKRKQR